MPRPVRMLLALLLALSGTCDSARADAPDRLTIFAAASLKGALDDVANAWADGRATPPRISYAATSALARQIEQGAPADIFVSADARWMDWLQQRDHIVADTRRDLVSNALVLIEPVGRNTALSLADGDDWIRALGDGRLAVARVDSVPAGTYARAALTDLGVWSMLEAHLAQTEDVRQALMFVARGEVPLGIVYRTDAQSGAQVRVVASFPTGSHAPIVYPVAAVDRAGASADTAAFLDFLHGDEAAAIFRQHGFDVLP
jgi:molybdate transport system substrate-binding protein